MYLPNAETPFDISYTVSKRKGVFTVKAERVRVEERDVTVVYAALGYFAEDSFHPVYTNCAPKMPFSFSLLLDKPSVLQVVDAYGRQTFLALETNQSDQ